MHSTLQKIYQAINGFATLTSNLFHLPSLKKKKKTTLIFLRQFPEKEVQFSHSDNFLDFSECFSVKVLQILVLFATPYLCEAGFSAIAVIKTKYQSQIDVEREMRMAVSKILRSFQK